MKPKQKKRNRKIRLDVIIFVGFILALVFALSNSNGNLTGAVIGTDNIEILAAPSISNLVIDGGNNTTSNNISLTWSISGGDGTWVKNITDWRLNGTSIAVLNMPFENDSASGLKDYSMDNRSPFTIIGTTHWNNTSGYDGKGAYEFDGTSDGLYYENTTYGKGMMFETGPMSVSAWVKTNDSVQHMIVDNKYAGTNRAGFNLYISTGGFATFRVANGDAQRTTSSDSGVDDNNWHYLVGVRDSSGTKIYVDGYLNNTDSLGGGYNISSNDTLCIGTYRTDGDSPFNGTMDEVMIFNRALTPEQILNFYNNRTDLIDANETSRRDNWSACITPNDGVQDGTMSCSENLTVLNSVPTLSDVEINSTDQYNRTNGTLICSYTFIDVDNDAESDNETQWYNNSELVTDLDNFTSVNFNNTTIDQNWTFSIRVYDGTNWSIWFNSSILEVSSLCNNNSMCEPARGENYTNCPNDCKENLIARWSFNSNHRSSTEVYDLSGNGYDGTIQGKVNFTGGIDNDTLLLNGSTDNYISLSSITDLDLFGGENGTLTVSALVKVNNEFDYNAICSGCGPIQLLSYGKTQTKAGNILISRSYDSNDPDTIYYAESSPMLLNNTWTHVIFMIKGGREYSYYVNCNPSRVVYDSVGLYDWGVSSIGNRGSAYSFNGSIDDLKIWNKTLSYDEIISECQSFSYCGNGVCNSGETFRDCPRDCLVFNCTNDENSSCIDFGEENDTNGNISINITTPPGNLSGNYTENGTSYRNLTSTGWINISFPAFNNDSEGLPLTDMVLEIRYKDVNNESIYVSTTRTNTNKVKITSLINFGNNSSKSYYDVDILGLDAYKSNQIFVRHSSLKKTNRQQIKAINGNYTFQIEMPSGDISDLPIDYVALHKINSSQLDALEVIQRDDRAVKKYEYLGDNDPIENVVWFTKNSTVSIYENTYPSYNEINNSIYKRVAKGEIFVISFSVSSTIDLENVTVVLNNLSSGEEVIPSGNFSIRHVVNDFKTWNSLNGYQTYGLMPDSIEEISNLTIKANKTKRFWITVTPEIMTAGSYTNNISVYNNSEKLFDVPTTVEIMDFTLDTQNYTHSMFAETFYEAYSFNDTAVYEDLTNHYSIINEPRPEGYSYSTTVTIIENGSDITGYNFTEFERRLDLLIGKGLVGNQHMIYERFYSIIRDYVGGIGTTVYEHYNQSNFSDAYGLLIRSMNDIADERGIEFLYFITDEPQTNEYKRVLADRLHTIIQNNSGKTIVTCSSACNTQVVGTGAFLGAPTGTILPDLDLVTDYNLRSFSTLNYTNIEDYDNFGYYATPYYLLANPIHNRFLMGYYPHEINATVIGVYAYGDVRGDPYNYFDSTYDSIKPFYKPDYVLSYPSWTGKMISKMGFEGFREGIIDARYIATLKNLIEANQANSIAIEADNYLSTRFSGISGMVYNDYDDKAENYGFHNVIISNLSLTDNETEYEVFDDIRQTIADYIIQLRAISTTTSDGSATGGSSGGGDSAICVVGIIKCVSDNSYQKCIKNGTTNSWSGIKKVSSGKVCEFGKLVDEEVESKENKTEEVVEEVITKVVYKKKSLLSRMIEKIKQIFIGPGKYWTFGIVNLIILSVGIYFIFKLLKRRKRMNKIVRKSKQRKNKIT